MKKLAITLMLFLPALAGAACTPSATGLGLCIPNFGDRWDVWSEKARTNFVLLNSSVPIASSTPTYSSLGVTNWITAGSSIAAGAGFYGAGTGLTAVPAGQLTGTVPTGSVDLSTVTTALGLKVNKAGDTMTGDLSISKSDPVLRLNSSSGLGVYAIATGGVDRFVGGADSNSGVMYLVDNSPAVKLNFTASPTTGNFNFIGWPLSVNKVTSPTHALDVTGGGVFSSSVTAASFHGPLTGNVTGAASLNVLKAGDTMTGALTLPADPASALQAATKQYVDSWTRPCVNPADANDIMVAVGPWCVDKYEASVWSTATGGTQYGSASDDYLCNDNGQDCAVGAANPVYARSVSGVAPSANLTWFQANMACFNAGKELLPNNVWQAAAAGTTDPGSTGSGTNCNVSGGAKENTGGATGCVSTWGAEDMIGNVWEWVAEWVAEPGWNGVMSTMKFNSDGYWHGGRQDSLEPARGLDGSNMTWDGAANSHEPGAVFRGGSWSHGANAGVFAFVANSAPSSSSTNIGFRCGRRR